MSRDGLCTFPDSEILRITEKGGILILVDGQEIWFYKDMIHDNSQIWNKVGQRGDLVISEYWAEKKGLV